MKRSTTVAIVCGIWLAYGLLYATWLRVHMPQYIVGFSWGTALRWSLPDAILWSALCFIPIQMSARLPLRRPRLGWRTLAHVSVGTLVAASHSVLDAWIGFVQGGYPGQTLAEATIMRLKESFPLNLLLYAIVVGVVHGMEHRRRLRAQEERTAALHAALSEAKLHALQMQIRPHFLMNALHTVNGLIDLDAHTAKRTIRQLGELLRATLAADRRPEVTLREELAFVEAYLDIERTRFHDRLEFEVEISPDCLDILVPCLLLQPLAENAIRHGIAPKADGGKVTVRGHEQNGKLTLEVVDDGVGMRPADLDGHPAHSTDANTRLAPAGDGIGLPNVQRRLQSLYGIDHAFHLASVAEGGVRVSIEIPARRVRLRDESAGSVNASSPRWAPSATATRRRPA